MSISLIAVRAQFESLQRQFEAETTKSAGVYHLYIEGPDDNIERWVHGPDAWKSVEKRCQWRREVSHGLVGNYPRALTAAEREKAADGFIPHDCRTIISDARGNPLAGWTKTRKVRGMLAAASSSDAFYAMASAGGRLLSQLPSPVKELLPRDAG